MNVGDALRSPVQMYDLAKDDLASGRLQYQLLITLFVTVNTRFWRCYCLATGLLVVASQRQHNILVAFIRIPSI